MPYTAPSQQPASAHPLENSDSDLHGNPDSASSASTSSSRRPQLPHSYSSTSYVRRHRRCSSLSESVSLHLGEGTGLSASKGIIDPHASLRQSPPPINIAKVPSGAIISPPDSGPNSSDEDEKAEKSRGRFALAELEAAIRSIQQQRDSSSPVWQKDETKIDPNTASSTSTMSQRSRPLSSSATAPSTRKVSHLRLSKESVVPKAPDSPSSSSDHDDDLDLNRNIPMVRKKSGELVRPALRPASFKRRPSSMPGTPTFAKNVHFDSKLEHIRHFMQLDKPLAVSANTSPVEICNHGEYPFGNSDSEAGSKAPPFEWELRLVNFPKHLSPEEWGPVHLERVFLSSDNKNLVGAVAVANIAFHKHVVARFTFDYWKTVSEVTAEYNQDVRRKRTQHGHDQFSFTIRLCDQTHLENKTMFFCIRYDVSGQEFWDNNSSMNYRVEFTKKWKNDNKGRQATPLIAGRPLHGLPRSRVPPLVNAARPRSMPSSLDDFAGFDLSNSFDQAGDDSDSESLQRLPRAKSRDFMLDTPPRREKPTRQAFGSRYDFGVSLSAAMQTKPATQDRTVLAANAKSGSQSPKSRHREDREARASATGAAALLHDQPKYASHSEPLKPSHIVSGKPHHESSIYKELVDKYCFYGSAKGLSSTPKWTPPVKSPDPMSNAHSPSQLSSTVTSPVHNNTTTPTDSAFIMNPWHVARDPLPLLTT